MAVIQKEEEQPHLVVAIQTEEGPQELREAHHPPMDQHTPQPEAAAAVAVPGHQRLEAELRT